MSEDAIVDDTFSIGIGASIDKEEIWVAQMYVNALAAEADTSGAVSINYLLGFTGLITQYFRHIN